MFHEAIFAPPLVPSTSHISHASHLWYKPTLGQYAGLNLRWVRSVIRGISDCFDYIFRLSPLAGWIFKWWHANLVQTFFTASYIIPASIKVQRSLVKVTRSFLHHHFVTIFFITIFMFFLWTNMQTRENLPYVTLHRLCYHWGQRSIWIGHFCKFIWIHLFVKS